VQSLTSAINPSTAVDAISADACALAVLDVTPAVVRLIRRLMLSHRTMGLSVPQFRTLALLSRSPKASLSCVADNIGSSLPAASRMIGVLVNKKLVARQLSRGDRRQLALGLTARGAHALKAARHVAQKHLAEKLSSLDTQTRSQIQFALELLGNIFGTDARPIVMNNDSPRSRNDCPVSR
jgi:DNA-binding MarR family transcriptional regulator